METLMSTFREGFVEHQNIAHYTNRLMTETDQLKRETLHKLLAEEMVKQAGHIKIKE
jgi:hypothetical protein